MTDAITAEGLVKTFGKGDKAVHALAGIDLVVPQGTVVGMLGPNGAGKTTTVEILEGYRKRSGGEVSVLGEDPHREAVAVFVVADAVALAGHRAGGVDERRHQVGLPDRVDALAQGEDPLQAGPGVDRRPGQGLELAGRATVDLVRNSFRAGLGLRVRRDFGCVSVVDDVLDRKRAALDRHRSQMERLRPGWLTLGDVMDGAFLDCFFTGRELFHRYEIPAR